MSGCRYAVACLPGSSIAVAQQQQLVPGLQVHGAETAPLAEHLQPALPQRPPGPHKCPQHAQIGAVGSRPLAYLVEPLVQAARSREQAGHFHFPRNGIALISGAPGVGAGPRVMGARVVVVVV